MGLNSLSKTGEGPQWVKVPAAKFDDPSLISGTHILGGENTQVVHFGMYPLLTYK